MARTTYAPQPDSPRTYDNGNEISWSDRGGNYLEIARYENGELGVSAGSSGEYPREDSQHAGFTIARPDAPDFLLALQTWIESLDSNPNVV